MKSANWRKRIGVVLALAAPGGSVFGTSCVESVRDSVVSAGLDFVESSAEDILNALFPVDEWAPAN